MATSTKCSSHMNCYATLGTCLAQLVIHLKRAIKTDRRETRLAHIYPRSYTTTWRMRILGREMNTTRAHQRSLTARVRAWLHRTWAFSLVFTGTQSFRENRHINVHVLIVQKLLVPLICRLVACSARTCEDRQTDRQTKYSNPLCAEG